MKKLIDMDNENYRITITYPDGTTRKLYWRDLYYLVSVIEMGEYPELMKNTANCIKDEMTNDGEFTEHLTYWFGE